MTTLLIILVLLALVFGVGAVLEGILWLLFIAVALVVALALFGWFRFRGAGSRRTTI